MLQSEIVRGVADGLSPIQDNEFRGLPTGFEFACNCRDGKANPLVIHDAEEQAVRFSDAVLLKNRSAYIIGGHVSLQNRSSEGDFNNFPADPFPLTSSANLGTAFALLGLALLYGFMAVFLGLFMFVRVKLIAVLLILAPVACVLWVLPGRPRQWGELWMDLFFSNLFVQFIQVLVLNVGVELLQTAGGDSAGFMQFLSGAATLLLVFRVPSLVNAAVGGGATSFLGIVALFRGLQHMGIRTLGQDAQRSMGQAAERVPGATWSFVQHPRATVTSASTQEWQGIADSPAGQVARAMGRAAGSAAGRVRDEATVRRGV